MIAWVYLDKKTAAVDALKDYASMVHIIQNQPQEVAGIREKMTSVSSGISSGVPGSHNPKAGESRLAASLDEIDVLKERYRSALEYMEWFKPAWDALTEDERFVLSEFYQDDDVKRIDSIGNICDHFAIERSSAYKKKNRALEKLATLLYGK